MSLASDVAAHVLEAFEYLDDTLEAVTIERLSPGAVDTDTGVIPTSPELHTVMAYVVERSVRVGDSWHPAATLVVFRTEELPFAMEASCCLQRADGRRYSVVRFETTTRALTIVEAASV